MTWIKQHVLKQGVAYLVLLLTLQFLTTTEGSTTTETNNRGVDQQQRGRATTEGSRLHF